MKKLIPALIVLAGAPCAALAQSNDPPPAAEGGAGSNLPDVQIIQEQQAAPKPATPKPAAAKPKPKPRPVQQQASSPPPLPPQDDDFEAIAEISEPAQILANSPYGATAGAGAAERAQFGSLNPINARTIIPGDLQNYAGAGSRVDSADLAAQRPITNHEALAKVPGVISVNDDGLARNGGIGIRGTPFRRSRKVLVMEDGQPINFATYLDSSSHYVPPTDRLESIEVLRGNVLNYGPLNNHGVVNFRNLSPFGDNETLLKFGVGYTEGADKDWNNFRHVHTRQNLGNVGIVASYSGSEAGGSWDNEVLRYNDFYSAIGFKGDNQDLTISGGFHRQRDRYDESNFNGTEAQFFANGRNKGNGPNPGFFNVIGFDDSSYNGDHYRLQIAHNYYFDKDTTLTTRLYGADHERARFYPAEFVDGVGDGNQDSFDEVLFEGRDRRYRNYGVDSRVEFANLHFFGGMKHDLQAGIRYEEQKFNNRNREAVGEVLDFDSRGPVVEQQKLDAESFAAFVQTAIHVTPTFTVTPGVRFENYDVSFREIIDGDASESQSFNHVLPGIAFAWEAMPRTTLYGGYHRGLTPHIIRDANDTGEGFPLDEEIGDNFQVGVRSTAARGFTIDMAVFHNRIDNYQFGEAFSIDDGDRAFSSVDKVEITGFEIYSRADSQPFHGGPWNVFGEATYTYADAEIEEGVNEDGESVAGNRIPESIRHYAHLTLGVEHKSGWDASVSYTYRGEFFTDSDNTRPITLDDGEVEAGLVDGQWLLSARTNYKVTDKVTLWATGQNLTDEFYITDLSDGIKPGIGRTVMGGFTIKFD